MTQSELLEEYKSSNKQGPVLIYSHNITSMCNPMLKNRDKLSQDLIESPQECHVHFPKFLEHHFKCEELSSFSILSEDDVRKVMRSRPTKHCRLDPVPTWLLKNNCDPMLPLMTAIINSSLMSGVFPGDFKIGVLQPLLKKIGLEPMVFKNLRPVSNLAFLSKVLESVVCGQYRGHLIKNGLDEVYQSAYKENHSVETAIVSVHNDIVRALDNKKAVVLVLLDLSAAFDTVDHDILLKLLNERIGVSGTALKWFSSYLKGRSQYVVVNGKTSKPAKLNCGVPQGSVLGPVLFTTYMLPLGDILRESDSDYHCYADDQQIYIEFFIDQSVKGNMERCLESILSWMKPNFMSCNTDKTEMSIIIPPKCPSPPSFHIVFNGDNVHSSKCIRNLGAFFDDRMTMEHHVNKVCQSAYLHLRNISRIRHCLDRRSCESLIHAFITSRLDSMNAILYGIPDNLAAKLQRVQNSAARLLCGIKKYDHITPTLKSLHWLPVRQRTVFKICVLAYKCIHGTAPQYLCKYLERYSPVRQLRSSDDKYLLVVPKIRTKFGERAFSWNAAKLWNELPYGIRSCSTIDTFKKKLKTHLFAISYE